MSVVIVPQLSDNFAYLVVDQAARRCVAVDCAEADKVLGAAAERGLKLAAALCTHWHGDHVGGNQALAQAVPAIEIYGGHAENGRIPALTHPVGDGDTIRLDSLEARVIAVPGHTRGHVAYYLAALGAVFTGDTLFAGGCGRLFEGDAATMLASLKRLAALPEATRVFCGHEYTVNNLKFALTLEPDNAALNARYARAVTARAEGRWTVPSTIAEEKATNPFLRADSAELRAALKARAPALGEDPVSVFALARALKDRF